MVCSLFFSGALFLSFTEYLLLSESIGGDYVSTQANSTFEISEQKSVYLFFLLILIILYLGPYLALLQALFFPLQSGIMLGWGTIWDAEN